MKNGFDPYYKWLGIPPKDQPPNYYRLLGIELLESDRDVIDAAANRVMAYLKDLAVGDEAEDSQKLLNEVARARLCLLNKEKKAAYDQTLRGELDAERNKTELPVAEPPPLREGSVPPTRGGEVVPPAVEPALEQRAKAPPLRPPPAEPPRQAPAAGKRRKSQGLSPAAIIIGGGAVLVIGGLAILAFVMADRSPRSTVRSEGAVDPYADVGSPLEPSTPPKTKPVKLRPRPHPGKRSSPFDAGDTPLPPLSEFLPKTAGTGQAGQDKPPGSDPDAPPAKLPLDFPNPSSTDPVPAGPPFSQTPAGMPELPKPATDGNPVPTTEPATYAKGAWRDLPVLVSLPDPNSAGGPMTLGTVHLSPGQPCSLKLLGGEDASRGSQAIVLRNVPGEAPERHWEVFARGPEAGSEVKIAQLAVGDDGQLGLEWQPAAGTHAAAPQLANCVLDLETDGESHQMRLREVAKADGLVVDLEKPTHKGDWKIDAVPDSDAVKVEISGVGGLKFTVQPSSPIPAEKGEAWVQIEDGGSLLLLQVETGLKRSFQVDITPHIKLAPDSKPERLIVKKMPQLLNQVTTNYQQLVVGIQQMRELIRRGAPNAQALEQQVQLNEQLCQAARMTSARVQELETLLKTKGNKLGMQIRVFYNAGESEVDLLHVGTPPEKPLDASRPGQAAKPAPAAKPGR